jgi:RND family efflux transporter MFP subunit
VDPGALVGPQTGPVLTVGRIDVLRVFVAVRERDAPALRVGQDTTVEVDARPGERFHGKVVRLSPAFDPLTRTLDAEVHLPNPDGKLRPGMYGRAAVQTSVHQGSLVVPEAAVQLVGEQRFVFIAVPGSQGHKAARRAVTIGVDGGEWLELTRGVRPEDEVIVAGIDALADAAPVRIQQSGAAPGKPAKAQ